MSCQPDVDGVVIAEVGVVEVSLVEVDDGDEGVLVCDQLEEDEVEDDIVSVSMPNFLFLTEMLSNLVTVFFSQTSRPPPPTRTAPLPPFPP